MKILVLLPIIAVLMLFVPLQSYEHRDGCHSKHSCPSDSGSYICGDLGYDSECPVVSKPVLPEIKIPDPPKVDKQPMEPWKNLHGDWVIVFSTSVEKLLERGYLQKETVEPTHEQKHEKKFTSYNECRADYMSKYCLHYGDGDYMKGECLKQTARTAEKVCSDYR